MLLYDNPSTDPFFNLALEQVLLEEFSGEPVLMLWRNAPSVILGVNQDPYTECDLDFAKANGIKIARRITGGGAVYHDLGNVNYTVLLPNTGEAPLDDRSFTEPIVSSLAALGVPVELTGRNDLTVSGKKISGHASCVRETCVLHHGTLLWDTDFSFLERVLTPSPDKLAGKGIQSVRSRVANLSCLLPKNPYLNANSSTEDFLSYLKRAVGFRPCELQSGTTLAALELVERRFSCWDWIYGKAGAFSASVSRRFPFGKIDLSFNADHGRILSVRITGDFMGDLPASELASRFNGGTVRLIASEICEAVPDIQSYIRGATPELFASLFE
ncbi:MAG: lipoate--protein ligase [Clostridia bacterium]|nr:lipoate--protein ligase [Clostridia bacterium]